MKDKTCEAIHNDPEYQRNMERLQEEDHQQLGELWEGDDVN